MKSNTNEIMQNLGRFFTVALCAVMNLGILNTEFTAAVLIVITTIQIYINVGMGIIAALKKYFEAWLALFHEVNLVVSLELLGLPGILGRQLVFKLTPSMVELATTLYIDNLKQMVIAVFVQIRQKAEEEFDEACAAAHALVANADSQTEELSQETQDALKDPSERDKIICEKVAISITAALLPQLESIVMPKASKMMSLIVQYEPDPPSIKGKIIKSSKKVLVEKKILPDPGKVLTKLMIPSFARMLPMFVRAIVWLRNNAPLSSPACAEHTRTQHGGVHIELVENQMTESGSEPAASASNKMESNDQGHGAASSLMLMCASESWDFPVHGNEASCAE
jgi:hypothetical protein